MCGLNKPKPLSAYTVDDLLYHLKRQFPDCVGTCNVCATEGCGKTVVGTGFCKDCLSTEFDGRGFTAWGFILKDALSKRQQAAQKVWEIEQQIREAAK